MSKREPVTYSVKLKAMRVDLAKIVANMNKDGQPGLAMKAQTAIIAIDALSAHDSGWFDDLEWSWKPSGEDQ